MVEIQQAAYVRGLIDQASRRAEGQFIGECEVWGDTPEHQFVAALVASAHAAVPNMLTIYGHTEQAIGTIGSLLSHPPRFTGGVQGDAHRIFLENGSIDYVIHGLIDDVQALDDEFYHGWRNSMFIVMAWLHGQQQLESCLTQLVEIAGRVLDLEQITEYVLRDTINMHVMAALYSAVQEAVTERPDVPMAWQEPFVVAHLQQEIKNLDTLKTVRTVQESKARRDVAQVQPEAPPEDDLFKL